VRESSSRTSFVASPATESGYSEPPSLESQELDARLETAGARARADEEWSECSFSSSFERA
jgi:hypothetical protein